MRILKFICIGMSCFSFYSLHAAELKSIGISVADLGNPFFVQIAETVASKARAMVGKEVKVIVRSSAYDLQRQLKQMNEFIEMRVDLIILVAADSQGIEPSVRSAQRVGIKVVAVDVNAAGADVTITTDNIQAGEIACEYLAQSLGGKGKWVIINGAPVSSVFERVAGCKSVLNNYPNITLLSDQLNGGGSPEGGMEVMTYLINAYEHIDAVFAINDPTAQGAMKAALQSGRDEFLITSVDGAFSAEQAIDQNSLWVASAAQFPRKMAEQAVELGLLLLKGQKVEPKVILIPAQLITSENIKSYKGWDH